MELFQAKDHYIVQSGEKALWCSRKDGSLQVRPATDLLLAWNPICLGLVEGVIGKIQLHTDFAWRLLLIRQKAVVGKLPGEHEVYKITKIAVIPLSEAEPQDLELELCKKHHFGINKTEKITQSPDDSKFLLKTFSQIKCNVAAPIKKKAKENKEKERLERRLLEELIKMFIDSDSFYYSLSYDLTNSIQRLSASEKRESPLWQRVDDRFFWNKHMIDDLIKLNDPKADFWIVPIIQGFVQIEELVVNYNESSDDEKSSPETPSQEQCVDDIHPRFLVAIISRRSRHRAAEEETTSKFAAHFEEQLNIYKKQVIVSLVDQTGREKIIGDAFLRQVLLYNNPSLTYVTFDFHEHCRGMKFENVQTLTDAISDIITDMKWGWVDQAGEICKQEGIFRVNCMDCLDRTNVVQAAIARVVMEQQLKKLGVMPPEQPLPQKCYRIYQIMWANNGDTISRQYAGTAALKGDFTRTGERKLAGMMKDGYNSANRYYLNRFRDAYRQAVIDPMQGIPVTEDLYSIFSKEKEHEALHKQNQRSQQEQISLLLQNYMKLLLPSDEKFHGGWAVIDCDPSLIDATHRDVDVLLLLSNCAYYVAYYDDEVDKVNQYQRLNLEDLEKIEIGPEPTFFGKPKFSCMRLHYKHNGTSGYFHTLRAVTRNPEEDGKDTLQCIAEMLQLTKQALGIDVSIVEKKLERKHSKPHEDILGIQSKSQASSSTSLTQGKNFLINKFSSLNQKVKQTKSNVTIGNLRKLGNFPKPDMKVNFLRPNLRVNLWKSDSSLGSSGSPVVVSKDDTDSDIEISSDTDSYESDDFLSNSKSEDDCQLTDSEDVGQCDYVLPSCGIVATGPRSRLGSRSQSISSSDFSIPSNPSDIHLTQRDPEQMSKVKVDVQPSDKAASADEDLLVDFNTPIDVYCHQFVEDAQHKTPEVPVADLVFHQQQQEQRNSILGDESKTDPEVTGPHLSRPSKLDVSSATSNLPFLSVEPPDPAASTSNSPSCISNPPEEEAGLQATPSSADDGGSRAVSPFAKIRSSMVQVASMTQAGLIQGVNFAVGKVQRTPDSVNDGQHPQLKDMFTQCQTRIIQI
uniref:phosphatidylinositide phosphatase SAC2 isoform X2 n=1 Tax=Pristiophorus japonicus TaxID=55135 RepID=UPI00398E5587